MPPEQITEARKTTSARDAVIAVPLSLRDHFEQMDQAPFAGAKLVYVDPGHPGHDFLNPDPAEPAKQGVLARVSAALRHGRG